MSQSTCCLFCRFIRNHFYEQQLQHRSITLESLQRRYIKHKQFLKTDAFQLPNNPTSVTITPLCTVKTHRNDPSGQSDLTDSAWLHTMVEQKLQVGWRILVVRVFQHSQTSKWIYGWSSQEVSICSQAAKSHLNSSKQRYESTDYDTEMASKPHFCVSVQLLSHPLFIHFLSKFFFLPCLIIVKVCASPDKRV